MRHVAHVESLDLQRDVLGDVGRKGAHRHLAGDHVEQAAVQAHADRGALEGHGDVRLDPLGELDLLEVDVGHVVLDLVELDLFDDRHVRRLVALDHDVEHGVHAGGRAHGGTQGVLVDGDADGGLARAVQDGRDQAGTTQTARLAAAGGVAGMYHEFHAIHVIFSPARTERSRRRTAR